MLAVCTRPLGKSAAGSTADYLAAQGRLIHCCEARRSGTYSYARRPARGRSNCVNVAGYVYGMRLLGLASRQAQHAEVECFSPGGTSEQASGSLSSGRLASKFVCIFFSTTTSGRLPLTTPTTCRSSLSAPPSTISSAATFLWAQSVVTCIHIKLWAFGSHSSEDHTSEVQQIHLSLSSRVAARSTC